MLLFGLCLFKKHDNSNGVVGEVRIVSKFILKPTVVNGDRRFLIRCKVKQEYYKTPCGHYCWINKEWLD